MVSVVFHRVLIERLEVFCGIPTPGTSVENSYDKDPHFAERQSDGNEAWGPFSLLILCYKGNPFVSPVTVSNMCGTCSWDNVLGTCFISPSPHELTKGQTSSARRNIEMPSILSAGQKSFESVRCQAKEQRFPAPLHNFVPCRLEGVVRELTRWWIFTKELWSCSDASIVPTPITVRRLPCQSCLKSECWSDEHVSVNPDQTHTRQEAR